MGRTKIFIRNSISTGALQVVTFALGVIVSRVMLSCYGSEINGLVSSINQLINYAKLVEAGLASAVVYALYKPLANKDVGLTSYIISAANRYYIQTGVVFSALICLIALLYPYIVDVTVLDAPETMLLVVILGLPGILSFFISAKYRALYTADQKQFVISYANIIAIVLHATVVMIFGYYLKANILILKLLCASTIIPMIFILIVYKKIHYPHLSYKTKSNYKIRSRWTVFINEIFGTIHFGSPIVVITTICNLLEVSVYSVYKLVFSGINSICNSLILPMSASFGETLVIENKTPFRKAYNEFEMAYYAANAFVYSCAYILILPFIKIYTRGVTDVEYIRPLIAFLFMLDAVSSNIYTPQAVIVRAGGYFKEVRFQTILQACITVCLGVPLTFIFGIAGILIASTIANLYRVTGMIVLVKKQNISINTRVTVKRIILSCVSIAVITLPFALADSVPWLSFLKLNVSNYLSWLLVAIPVAVFAGTITLLVNLFFERSAMVCFFRRIIASFK